MSTKIKNSTTVVGRWGVMERMGHTILSRFLAKWKGDLLKIHLPDKSTVLLGDKNAKPNAFMDIHNLLFFKRILLRSDLGFGESYMEGEWTTPNLVTLLQNFARQGTTEAKSLWNFPARIWERFCHRMRANTIAGSRRNISAHYDLGNEFYSAWLDPSLQYSSAIFPNEQASLESAQDVKLRTIIAKLDLQPGMRVLEIGSGWGELGVRIVRDCGCLLTTVTLSQEQFRHVQARIHDEGLAGRMEVRLQDYRTLHGKFDRVVSVEMIEAVGHKNLPTYFTQVERLLVPQGKAVIEAITIPEDRYASYLRNTDFIQTYIFPGGHCPSLQAMINAIAKKTRLKVQHVDDYSMDYALTLKAWRERFLANWSRISKLGFDQRFRRMWEYYLACCEAGYRASILGLVQIVLQNPSGI